VGAATEMEMKEKEASFIHHLLVQVLR